MRKKIFLAGHNGMVGSAISFNLKKTGHDITIKELAEMIRKVVGYNGKINFDSSKPDGPARKLVDSKRINNLGFNHETSLWSGLVKTYEDFLKNHANN